VDRLRQAADPAAASRLELEEARDLIAQQAGSKTWAAFLESVAPAPPVAALSPAAQRSHQAAQDFVNAAERDPAALQRLNEYYARSFTYEDVRAEIWRRVYAFRSVLSGCR
jgi:hypothetical protein